MAVEPCTGPLPLLLLLLFWARARAASAPRASPPPAARPRAPQALAAILAAERPGQTGGTAPGARRLGGVRRGAAPRAASAPAAVGRPTEGANCVSDSPFPASFIDHDGLV